jgi:site-specific recombinase XerD
LDAAEDAEELRLIMDAAETEAEQMRPAQREAFENAMSGKVEVERYLEDHIKTTGLAPKTVSERRGIVMMLARWCADQGVTLDQVDRKQAGRYVSDVLEAKHLKTQAKNLSSLRQYWIYLSQKGHVTRPQGEAIKSGWPWNDQLIARQGKRVERGSKKELERPFTDAEVSTLLNSAYPFKKTGEMIMRDVLLVSLLSGMRQAEIVTIWVEEVVQDNDGHLYFNLQQGKNASAPRKVPVHSSLAKMVRGRMKGKQPRSMLFHELEGRSNPADTYGKRFKPLREFFGIDEKQADTRRSLVNFHSARRWFTTKARHAGQAKEVIGDVIGHQPDKQDITFGVYAREASEDQRRACVQAVKLPDS